MYRRTHVALLLFLISLPAFVQAAPSRGFIQEFGRVSPAGPIYVDLYNSTGKWTSAAESQLRFGAPTGEIILSENSIGYKGLVRQDLAAYLFGSATTSDKESFGLRAGLALRMRAAAALLNINPELLRQNGLNSLVLNGGIFMALKTPAWVRALQMGGEFSISDSPDNNISLAFGLRWLPRDEMTVDLMFVGRGGENTSITIRSPAALRFNFRF